MNISTKHLFLSAAYTMGSEVMMLFDDGRALNGRVREMIDDRFVILSVNIFLSSDCFLIDLKRVAIVAAK
jgi:hypothetical protein